MACFKASFFGKVDSKVAYNINASVHNAYSILSQYKCKYSYIDVAFIYIYNSVCVFVCSRFTPKLRQE